MNFCVLAKIARHSVSFWYQSDGNPYAPLSIKETNEVPLYFYVNDNDFSFGNAARDRFHRNDPNAYGNYFEIIKDPTLHFSIYGNQKPIKQLFYHGIEQYLSHFLNTVLYKTDSIESYRQNFPLRLLFDKDIDDNEKSLIELLFQEAGYFNVDRIDFNKTLFEVITQQDTSLNGKSMLLLSGINDVLYLQLYQNINTEPIGHAKLEEQGADPRVRILANMIVEYIIAQNSYLSIDIDREIKFLLLYCSKLLENVVPIIKGDAELSDGNRYWFRVNERNLNERLNYYSNDGLIYTAIDDLLKLGDLSSQNVVILLGTEQISSSYFSNKLLRKYHHVREVSSATNMATMKAIFSAIAKSNFILKSTQQILIPPPENPQLVRPKMPPPPLPKKPISTPTDLPVPKMPEEKIQAEHKIKTVPPPPLPPKKISK